MISKLGKYQGLGITAIGLVIALAVNWNNNTQLDTILTICTVGLIAISMGLVYGQGGMLSLAPAAFAAIGAYSTAILTTKYDMPIVAGLALAVLMPAAIAFVLARLIVRLSHLALAVATLLLSQLLSFLLASGGDFTGGYVGLYGIPSPEWMSTLRDQALVGAVLVLIATFVLIRVAHSQQGRALRAIAADSTMASSLGINVSARLSWAFCLGAAIAGVAGWFYAHTRTFLAPESLSLHMSLTVLFMLIVGGRSTILGPLLGTAVLTLLDGALPAASVRDMFYGSALILALIVFPEGLLGTRWGAALRALRRMNRSRDHADEVERTSGPAPARTIHAPADKAV